MSTLPKADDFRELINHWIKDARQKGQAYIDLVSGDVHRELGGYPGDNHRMPTCCSVMLSMMKASDQVLSQPDKGKGAYLTIRYFT
ncbi:hypothetical protein [Brevibacillus gelatini]